MQADIRQRKAVLVWFATLQRCTALSAAVSTFTDIHCILCSKADNDSVVSAKDRLQAMATGMVLPDIDENADDLENQQQILEESNMDATNGTLKERSPFSRIFSVKEISQSNENDQIDTTNASYAPNSFKVLLDIIHLFPLWSATLQTEPKRFASDLDSTIHNTVGIDQPRCLTNGLVESHFRSIKHGQLGHRSRVRPRLFLEFELAYVTGKLNEQLIPEPPKRKRKAAVGSDLSSEKWKRRSKSGKYSNFTAARKILKSLPGRVITRKNHRP